MVRVFLLQHTVPRDDHENTKLIGVYSDQARADEAIRRLKTKPGFRDPIGDFTIGPYILDQDYWADGFGVDEE